MHGRTMFMVILLGLALFIEGYVFFAVKSVVPSIKGKRIATVVYLLQSMVVLYAFWCVYQSSNEGLTLRSPAYNNMLAIIFISFLTKILLACFLLLQDGGRLAVGFFNWLQGFFIPNDTGKAMIPGRRTFLTNTSLLLTSIPFFSLLYGVTKGKYNFKINKVNLASKNLPKGFNNFKIVQISDIHAGSLDSKSEVIKAVELINEQKPDIILFTGDLVNSNKDEINPYVDIFANLKAKYGKYAILGNHDYYGLNGVPKNKHQAYWNDFYTKYDKMGFDLLRNSNRKIIVGRDHIQLLGVENWGAGSFFQKLGDLDHSLNGVEDEDYCVLMSHDPTHWDHKVISHSKHIDLTLSGHTHGMQFGINMPGFKWSPVKYRYKHWMGLYENKGQYLYVNRGFGFLGFPGRVGMWPEITVINLNAV